MNSVKIPLGVIDVTPAQIELVNRCLFNRRLSYGPMTRLFEKRLAEIHEVQHAVFMASGTCALQVLLKALKEMFEWDDDAEVIVPATTFIATMSAVRDAGLVPVLCDVEMKSFGICPIDVVEVSTPKTVAVLPVHLLGRSVDIMRIAECVPSGIKIIEDACEFLGCKRQLSYEDRFCAVSTYVCHHVSTGVGGAVLTDNSVLASICRSLMQHGRDRQYLCMDDDDDLDEEQMENMMGARYRFVRWGHSFRATEMEAALGIGALNDMPVDTDAECRRFVARLIASTLEEYPSIAPQEFPNDSSPLFYPFLMDTPQNCLGLAKAFEAAGIETRPMMPLLNQPIVQKELMRSGASCWKQFPNATRLCHNAFLIGCHRFIEGSHFDLIRSVTDQYFKGLA